MRSWVLATVVAAGVLAGGGAAGAHHSFAVFFNSDADVVTLKGVVKEFHFVNPHGAIVLVSGTAADQTEWRVETNSPSILYRRGWTQASLKVGDVVTVKGWPARDGTHYMRMREVLRADGTPVGQLRSGQ